MNFTYAILNTLFVYVRWFFCVTIDQSHCKNTMDISLLKRERFFIQTIHYRIHEYHGVNCKVINFHSQLHSHSHSHSLLVDFKSLLVRRSYHF